MWAGLQHLCLGQGTCPRGLEETRAQKGSWLCVSGLCQPAKHRLCIWPLGTWGELEQGLKGALVPARKVLWGTGTREAWQGLYLCIVYLWQEQVERSGEGRGVSISWREMMVLAGVG